MSITAKLIDECKRGKTRAQLKLFKLCYPWLMPVCRRYVKANETDEVLNIGFYKVLQGLRKYDFRNEELFVHWTRRVVINAIIDELRRAKKYKTTNVSFDHQDMNGIQSKATRNEGELQLDVEHIYKMIAQLPNVQQEVFNLHVIDSYTHKEIGEMIGISESTSRWYLAQARKSMQAKLAIYMKHQIKVKA